MFKVGDQVMPFRRATLYRGTTPFTCWWTADTRWLAYLADESGRIFRVRDYPNALTVERLQASVWQFTQQSKQGIPCAEPRENTLPALAE